MNYVEAIEATISAKQARIEIERHGLSYADFVADCGKRDSYKGKTILDWLGYQMKQCRNEPPLIGQLIGAILLNALVFGIALTFPM